MENIRDKGNQLLMKLFGLKPDWHKNLDIIKNNYVLAKNYMQQGNYKEASYRLRFLVWLDKEHQAGWLDLARCYAAMGEKDKALEALGKLLALNKNHKEAHAFKQSLETGKVLDAGAIEISEDMDAKTLYQIHKACFPIYWKEAEIAEMLLTSGTRAWVARLVEPVGMLITRSQFEQAEILTIGVLEEARGAGVAKEMMKKAHKKLVDSDVKKIFLEVAENNLAAIALYKGLGYAESGRRAAYYKQEDGTRTDALVMSKTLVNSN